MIIYPAIDLMEGAVVRLNKGRFDHSTEYSTHPAEVLDSFAAAGAEWTHIVDLDGARAGEPRQYDLIGELAGQTDLKIQAAGGVRKREDIARLLDSGVTRVVVGSMCVKSPDTVEAWIAEFGTEHIAAAMDVRMEDNAPEVAISGWAEDSGIDLWTALNAFPKGKLVHLLTTDVNRDGAMKGPNMRLLDQVRGRRPDLDIQASGGVRDIADIRALAEMGAGGAVVGKALYENRLDLKEALSAGAPDHPLP